MDKKDQNTSLPDISGVFDIDESSIPSDVIAPDAGAGERPKDYEPILLNDPVQEKLDKKEEKKQKALRKAEKREAKRKQTKKRVIIVAVCAAVFLAAVFGVKFAVDSSRRPTGDIIRSYTGSIARHYDTEALLTSAVVGQGEIKTVAVFSENDYDIYSITKGLSAEITIEDSPVITGRVIDITHEASDSSVTQKIMEAFPDGEYSSGMNYVITVETDTDYAVTDNIVGDIRIITSISDNAVLVPSTAVHKDGAKYYVWIYKPLSRTAVRQEVSVGINSDGLTEITKGLKNDTRVVSSFSCEDEQLTETMKIKVNK